LYNKNSALQSAPNEYTVKTEINWRIKLKEKQGLSPFARAVIETTERSLEEQYGAEAEMLGAEGMVTVPQKEEVTDAL
jgi:hypothetical protein